MTNKIDETVEIPNETPDSGTRREDGWYMASYCYDDETVESPAKVKGDDIQFFGDSFWRGARSDRVTLLYRITPPASLAAKDKEIARLKIALADAIRRPMGVIPDSAAGLISIDEMDEAEKRWTAETSSLAAMREAIEVAREVFTQFEEGCGKPISFNLLSTLGQKLADIDSTTPPAPKQDDGLAKLLREIEWRGDVYEMDGQRFEVCPLCEQDKDDGHSPDCSLARWIAKAEEGK